MIFLGRFSTLMQTGDVLKVSLYILVLMGLSYRVAGYYQTERSAAEEKMVEYETVYSESEAEERERDSA